MRVSFAEDELDRAVLEDWNPDAGPSDAAELGVLAGVRVASTDHWSFNVRWMFFTRAMHFSAGAISSPRYCRAPSARASPA